MRTRSAATLAALDAGEILRVGAVRLGLATPALYWGGHGSLSLDAGVAGSEPYLGIGSRALVSASGGTLGGTDQGADIVLSGVDPDILGTLNIAALRGVSVVIWRLFFSPDGQTMTDAEVHLRGKVDTAPREETPKGDATLRIRVIGSSRGLGRRRERMRADFDQRLITGAGSDDGFKQIAIAPFIQLNWGGKAPVRAAQGIPNSGGSVSGSPSQSFVNDTVANVFR